MLYSFGHGKMNQQETIDALSQVRCRRSDLRIIDARSHPESKWPDWNADSLRTWVPETYCDYEWWPGLGGYRREHAGESVMVQVWQEQYDVDVTAYAGRFPTGLCAKHLPGYDDPSVAAWTVKGFWDYQFFMLLDEFKRSVASLVQRFGGPDKPDAAFFCCETLWWKCHRSMVADYIGYVYGVQVVHEPFHAGHLGHAERRLARYHPVVRERMEADKCLIVNMQAQLAI